MSAWPIPQQATANRLTTLHPCMPNNTLEALWPSLTCIAQHDLTGISMPVNRRKKNNPRTYLLTCASCPELQDLAILKGRRKEQDTKTLFARVNKWNAPDTLHNVPWRYNDPVLGIFDPQPHTQRSTTKPEIADSHVNKCPQQPLRH